MGSVHEPYKAEREYYEEHKDSFYGQLYQKMSKEELIGKIFLDEKLNNEPHLKASKMNSEVQALALEKMRKAIEEEKPALIVALASFIK